jgi:Spy/CpxP family protein refolding chaperone
MTIKSSILLCLSAALASTLVFGQGPGGPPDPATMIQMRVNLLTAQLGLSDSQKASATTIFTDASTAAQPIQSNLRTNRQALLDAAKKNDSASIDQLSATAGILTAQFTAIETKAEAAFYAILTADQKTKFDSLPHGGPGGMGFGPMGPARARGR